MRNATGPSAAHPTGSGLPTKTTQPPRVTSGHLSIDLTQVGSQSFSGPRHPDEEPQVPDYSYACGICHLPILTAYHDRHSDGSGHYHIACEVGRAPLYLKWLQQEARHVRFP